MAVPGTGILKGLWTTLKHAIKWDVVTVQYPDQRKPGRTFDYKVMPRFRGAPMLVFDEATGTPRCVGCAVCVRACPHGIIHLETSRGPNEQRIIEKYEIEVGRCLFCGLCEEACPFNAVKLSNDFELSHYSLYTICYGRDYWLAGRRSEITPTEFTPRVLTERTPMLVTEGKK